MCKAALCECIKYVIMDRNDDIRLFYDRLQVLEDTDETMEPEARLRAVARPLLAWYGEHARVLPWRSAPSGYRVWISEIMLQQTRVEAVKPYFERFVTELPDVRALAEVPDDRLMKLWEGLGYYSRARNLKKAAQLVTERYGGELPKDYESLLALPGIGSYTAGAIASIAFGQAVPAVDGNVLRVVSRVLASRDDILKQATKKRLERLLAETMPRERTGDFNQAFIEVGAVVCVPNGEPKCGECPCFSLCLARQRGLTEVIPVRTPAKARRIEERTVCLLECGRQVVLRRRAATGLLASLYELPNEEGHLAADHLAETFGFSPEAVIDIERLPDARHIFTHVEWRMIGYRVRLKKLPPGCIAAGREELETVYALPNAFGKYAGLVR